MEVLHEKLCSFFKYKLDGSRFYIGRSMTDVHKNLGISDEMFDKMCQVFMTTLRKHTKGKVKVFQAFYRRIISLRSEICHPPVKVQQPPVPREVR